MSVAAAALPAGSRGGGGGIAAAARAVPSPAAASRGGRGGGGGIMAPATRPRRHACGTALGSEAGPSRPQEGLVHLLARYAPLCVCSRLAAARSPSPGSPRGLEAFSARFPVAVLAMLTTPVVVAGVWRAPAPRASRRAARCGSCGGARAGASARLAGAARLGQPAPRSSSAKFSATPRRRGALLVSAALADGGDEPAPERALVRLPATRSAWPPPPQNARAWAPRYRACLPTRVPTSQRRR